MNITKALHVADRRSWRAWLRRHYRSEKEIWLVFYRKETGKPRVPYSDAVEEALCFGWIDSTVKKLDEDRFAQRFSRRNPPSGYSQTNKERLWRMIAAGKIAKDVLAGLEDISPEKYAFPPDIMKVLRTNRRAWKNFQKYSAPYRRIRVSHIEHARPHPTEFNKRMENFLKLTAQDKQFGYGIESFF